MKKILFFFLVVMSSMASAQVKLIGTVSDEEKKPALYATVSLLKPADSTLAYYGITNDQGYFEIKGIEPGKYILQCALYMYSTFQKEIRLHKDTISMMQLEPLAKELGQVDIVAERVPLLIKKDTVEYDAGAFKTRSDANAEELLKKLPGVEVDRAGNIKAQGESVNKVYVDGKEFFGDDPKVATKNLPADAIKKVQVYDKKSDETELTGMDDGTHQKVLNLVLKDGKKSAWLGDVSAGGGTGEHFQTSAKLYRFKKQSQFAALGMFNNINQFGFTFSDYLSFSGGMQSLSNGDGLGRILADENTPVNFGQPVNGLVTSGAGGLNYSFEKKKGNRFNVSYLGNGAQRLLDELTYSNNFTSFNAFEKYDTLKENKNNHRHNLNLGWRYKIDSTAHINFQANASYAKVNSKYTQHNQSFSNDSLVNGAFVQNENRNDEWNSGFSFSYLKKLYSSWRLFKINADGDFSGGNSNETSFNLTDFYATGVVLNQHWYQENQRISTNGSVYISGTRLLGKNGFLIEPGIRAGINYNGLHRVQKSSEEQVDSLGGDFINSYAYLRPSVSIRKNNDRNRIGFVLRGEFSQMENQYHQQKLTERNYFFLLPEINWELEYKTQRRLSAGYFTRVNRPQSFQLMPVADISNPLQLYAGNVNLDPEQIHNLNFNWWVFDQFSMTSFFTGIRAQYTRNKISYARFIHPDLSQDLTFVNVPDDYRLSAHADFTTPIRKLKINFKVKLEETYSRGINVLNGVNNVNSNLIHSGSLGFDNRKKEKWDIQAGINASYTQAQYSVSAGNNDYSSYGYFAEITYTPSARINFFVAADVSNYNSAGFKSSIIIPLLNAEIRFYFLKNNRGILSIEAYDLLNKNTGLQRISEINYLMEKQSNIIQQYFMLSFKYRLNKFDTSNNVKIEVNGK